MKTTLVEDQKILIEVYNNKTKQTDWITGTFIQYCTATDIAFRVECISDSGIHYAGICAAHPDCIKPNP